MNIKNSSNIVEYIINNIDQIKLFSTYLNISTKDIEYCLLDKSYKIRNPLRNDINPSLGFMYTDKGKLIFRDWGNSMYRGDIIDLVGILYNKNPNIARDFKFIISDIIKTSKSNKTVSNTIRNINKNSIKHIKILEDDIENIYNIFEVANVDINFLRYRNVYSAKYVWIKDNNSPTYVATKNNKIIAYYLDHKYSIPLWQIYRPDSNKNKFATNGNYVFHGMHELYDADILIITKSRKDRLTIESNIYEDDKILSSIIMNTLNKSEVYSSLYSNDNTEYFKYCVTSLVSESILLSPIFINKLKEIYPVIILNVDFDKAGIFNAFYHSVLFNIIPVFLGNITFDINTILKSEIKSLIRRIKSIQNIDITEDDFYRFVNNNRDNYKVKDIYDYFKEYGINKGRELVNELFNYNKLIKYAI